MEREKKMITIFNRNIKNITKNEKAYEEMVFSVQIKPIDQG